jgi:glyoxylase-like metal-dependent hydrolase (beta-lactamase superfamily II)
LAVSGRSLEQPEPVGFVDLGRIRVCPLIDALGSFSRFAEAFPNATAAAEQAGRARYPSVFDRSRWVLAFRGFLVVSSTHTLLVDCGVGPPPGEFLPERQGWLLAHLRSCGVSTADVDLVVLTHLHVDHVGWAVVGGRPTFPRARYVVSDADVQFFASRPVAATLAALRRADALEVVRRDVPDLGSGIRLRVTPGHTPGHLSVELDGGSKQAIVAGDVAVHPLQIDDPSLAYVFDEQPSEATKTRIAFVEEACDRKLLVCAGHLPGGLGYVVREEIGLRWDSRRADPV